MSSLLQVKKNIFSTTNSSITYFIKATNIGLVNFTGTVVFSDSPGTGLVWNGGDGWTVVGSKLEKVFIGATIAPGTSIGTFLTLNIVPGAKLLINSVDILRDEISISHDSVAISVC